MAEKTNYEIKCRECGLVQGEINGLTFHWEEGMKGHICGLCRNEPSKLMLEIIGREIKKRLRKLGVKTTGCKRCGKEIFFLTTKNEKSAPITLTLINHFADCKFAKDFKKQ